MPTYASLIVPAFAALVAVAAASQSACADAVGEAGDTLELLQLNTDHSTKLDKAASVSNHSADEAANASFNPFSAIAEKTKYCSMGTLCAQQTSHIDFTKLGALCVVMTGGGYSPTKAKLPTGTCASANFECPASSDAVTKAFSSSAMMQTLPSPLATAAAVMQGSATKVLQPIQEKVLAAMSDDISMFTVTDSWSGCPK